MAFLDKVKKWFGYEYIEEKIKEEEPVKVFSEAQLIRELNEEEVQEIEAKKQDTEKKYVEHKCELCGNIIEFDRYTKKSGKWFHKSCYKKQFKQLKADGKVF
jgi:formylmethanofuran dehydrogenase subunit E